MSNYNKAYPSKEKKKDIIFEDIHGPKIIKRDGSKSWRNNNPGNIERGEFSRNNGSIGDDGRFAIFPSYEAGRMALDKLLSSKSYKDLNVEDAMKKYAPAHENNTDSYTKFLETQASVTRKKKIKDLSNEGKKAVADAIEKYEGAIPGDIIPLPRKKPIYDATGRFIRE